MKIQQFQGGENSRPRPQYLGQNEAVIYENIDNTAVSLTPIKTKLATAIVVQQYPHYYEAQQEWVSSSVERDYVEFQDTLYWTDRAGGLPQKYDGTNTWNLGITPPASAGSYTIDAWPEPVGGVTADVVETGGSLPIEDLYYILVNTTSSRFSNILTIKVDSNGRTATVAENTQEVLKPFVASTDKGLTRQVTFKRPRGLDIATGGIQVFRLYDGEYRKVGDLASKSASFTDTTEDISGNTLFDETKFAALNGKYQYVLTFYNSVDGSESGPTSPSGEIDITKGGEINVTALPISSDPQVDQKKLYRVGGDLTKFTEVATLANAATTYTDATADADLTGSLLTTDTYLPAEAAFKFLTEAYGMLFAAEEEKLRFTPIGVPDAWPELNFIGYEAPITGIAPVANGVLVFTKFKTHIVTGTGPTSLTTQLLRGDQGCISHSSIQPLEGAALWASTDGICTSSGGNVVLITKNKLGKLSLDPVDSAIFDEAYYLLETDGTMLVFDYGFGRIFKRYNLSLSTLAVASDKLYGWSSSVLYELFAGTTNETFRYLSPRFIEGASTERKTYKRVNIYSKGDIIVNILIDDVVVATRTLSTEDSHDISVPQDKQRGSFLQLDISGTGEVYEIEWQVGRQKGGR